MMMMFLGAMMKFDNDDVNDDSDDNDDVTKLTAGIIAASSLGGKRVHTEADKYNAQLPSLRTSHPDRLGFVLIRIQISFGKQIDICQFNAPYF